MSEDRDDAVAVLMIAVFAAIQIGVSLWMVLAPRSFFENLGPFGVYNGHYLRDTAAFQGGIGLALAASIWFRALRPGAVAALLAAFVLHAINHFVDINAANGDSHADVIDAISITLGALAIGWLLARVLRPRG